ncbi:MAG: 30S ribosomal protein S7 [Patescibacteria group bacterium]
MRRKKLYKKEHRPDYRHQNIVAGRFINYLMNDGKKAIAEKVLYDAFDIIKEETKEDPLEVFEKAIANVSPAVEVVSTRVGGANYQVPREVRADRKFVLAARWLIGAARAKKGAPMAKHLAAELLAAYKNEGEAMKKKQNTHRMAEANRAFAHFARR